MTSYEIAKSTAKVLSDKKAADILILNVAEQTVVCSYLVIASGRSTTQVRALCENVEEEMKKSEIVPLRTEGVREGRWGVLDYGDVVVHVFHDESRLFYNLERLWMNENNAEHLSE